RWFLRRWKLLDVRSSVFTTIPLDVAERPDFGHGRGTSGIGAVDGATQHDRGTRWGMVRCGGGGVQRAYSRTVRTAGEPVLFHGTVVGRRGDRPCRHSNRCGTGARSGSELPTGRRFLRRI